LVGVVAEFFVEFGEFGLLFVQGGDFFFQALGFCGGSASAPFG
jgi:hypothetical protein